MRFYSIFFLLFAAIASCQQPDGTAKSPYAGDTSAKAVNAKLTNIEWKEKSVNYGKIKEGETLNLEFHFKNTGEAPLLISRVEPSCGCTVAEFPKEPIPPGKEGTIKGSFNSAGKISTQHKTLMVYANSASAQPTELSFDVEVEPKN